MRIRFTPSAKHSELRHEVNRLRLENSELRQSLLSGPTSNSSTSDHHMTLEHLFDVDSRATATDDVNTTGIDDNRGRRSNAAVSAMRIHNDNSKQQHDDADTTPSLPDDVQLRL